jgi:hypothetical protein
MAARSTGLFPREGFNLDAECEVTTSPTAAKVTLAHAKTIRLVVIGLVGGDATITLGGQTVVVAEATDLDLNGVGIAHIRGALCDADNNISYSLSAGTVGGVFYELVDGPKR